MTRLVKPLAVATAALGCAAGVVSALQPPVPPAAAKVVDKPAAEKPGTARAGPVRSVPRSGQ